VKDRNSRDESELEVFRMCVVAGSAGDVGGSDETHAVNKTRPQDALLDREVWI